MNNRIKNPYFWFGLIAVIFTAIGADLETFTSRQALYSTLLETAKNPFLLGSTIVAITGVFVNPTTGGLIDGE